MIVTATLRVRSKHAEALKGFVRALGAQIKLEADPVFEEIEDELPKEVIREQGLRGVGDEVGSRNGDQEDAPNVGDRVEVAVDAGDDGQLAGAPGKDATGVASEQHADEGAAGSVREQGEGAVERK